MTISHRMNVYVKSAVTSDMLTYGDKIRLHVTDSQESGPWSLFVAVILVHPFIVKAMKQRPQSVLTIHRGDSTGSASCWPLSPPLPLNWYLQSHPIAAQAACRDSPT